MRRKGEKGSLSSSATFLGFWQLCHPLNLSLQAPLFPVSTGSSEGWNSLAAGRFPHLLLFDLSSRSD